MRTKLGTFERNLKTKLEETLSQHGFAGDYPCFHRARGEHVDLIAFSYDLDEGLFVDLGVAPKAITAPSGEILHGTELRPDLVSDEWRAPLAPGRHGSGPFPTDDPEATAGAVGAALRRAEAWWADRAAKLGDATELELGTVLRVAGTGLVAATTGAAVVRLMRSPGFRPWLGAFVLGWGLIGVGSLLRPRPKRGA